MKLEQALVGVKLNNCFDCKKALQNAGLAPVFSPETVEKIQFAGLCAAVFGLGLVVATIINILL